MAISAIRLFIILSIVAGMLSGPQPAAANPRLDQKVSDPVAAGPALHLKSRDFSPGRPGVALLRPELARLSRADQARVHILVQLDFIPRAAARAAYEKAGVRLLAYVPDFGWTASVPAADPTVILNLQGVTWAGELSPDDKLDAAIRAAEWGSWNLDPNGIAAVSIVMHPDETLENGRALALKAGARVIGQVEGLRALLIELPAAEIKTLAAADAIQWIEPAEPALGGANDGIRQQIGVDDVQASPYNLNGAGVQILIYDTGIVTPTHADFSGRLTIGANDAGMTVTDHSTHVAGTAAGSGNRSLAAGGTSLQWRGMAPGANIISYAYDRNNTGMLFYNDPGDIENNWAAAQNSHGADIGNASLGSNIYANYPLSCTQMGNYGLTSGLMDQIIRGGNTVVGAGDKFIATWAVGNERPSACGAGGYGTLAPPASAKNPIHVGASNTNNNSMTSFSSWGPTDDGRIKPIVVAGGAQIGGDLGIKSTIPRLFVDRSASLNCDGSGDDYCYPYDVLQGTSMAAPAVAGSIALMLQHYRAVNLTSGNFWPATAKALLMQTADDFGNPGPDYSWGFGQVRIKEAVDLISRHGFFQNNVDQDETDLYIVQVTTGGLPLQVSVAWDDYEATFNANPTLINDIDLELVAPSGTIWRPWVLDPANPGNNATRGINTRDNEEQVTVPSAELGTWLARVKGKTIPQGPQDYAIACDGCRVVNAGVCQAAAGKTPLIPATFGPGDGLVMNSKGDTFAEVGTFPAPQSAGAAWERGLGGQVSAFTRIPSAPGDEDTETAGMRLLASPTALEQANRDAFDAELRAFDATRNGGPAAVIAFAKDASPAMQALISEELDSAAATPARAPAGFALPWVGVDAGCAYYTIQAAVDAAPNGATVRVQSGFYAENVNIGAGKVITIEGGYGFLCLTPEADISRIDASTSGSVIDVSGGAIVKLKKLTLGWGSSIGAGLDVIGNSQVTLDGTSIAHNNGSSGGGLYVGGGSQVTLTNSSVVRNNTASSGGGAIVYGRLNSLDNASDLTQNCATGDGGGAYVSGGTLLLSGADVTANQAMGPAGRGGGIYAVSGAVVTLTNFTFVGESAPCCNTADEGAGIYADHSRITSLGGNIAILQNHATGRGGGLFLNNGSVFSAATGTHVGYAAFAGNGNTAPLGAGIYAQTSTILFNGDIINNIGETEGAGVYADASVLTLNGATIGGTGLNQQNELTSTAHAYGIGMYLTNKTQATLSGSVVTSNTWSSTGASYRGGGAYVDAGSALTLTNSRIERHTTPASGIGRGAGLYVFNARVVIDASDVLSNSAHDNGGGIRMLSGDLMALNGSSVSNNDAVQAEGGGIAAASGTVIGLTDVTLHDNTAGTDGGAIQTAALVSITGRFDIRSNRAGGNGGAISVVAGGRLDLRGDDGDTSRLSSNSAGADGGALYSNGGWLSIRSTVLDRNSASRGGAFYQDGASSRSWLSNTLIYSNTSALSFGAGIRNNSGAMTLTHVTAANNSGGAGFSPGTAQSYIFNSIFWGNTTASLNPLTSAVCNFDQGGAAGPATNPMFVAAGAGENYRLRPGSPAVDACADRLPVDLDNRVRPIGPLSDMGAYELRTWRANLPLALR